MKNWILYEKTEEGEKKLYTPLPMFFDDAMKLKNQLTFMDSWNRVTKGLSTDREWIVMKIDKYKQTLDRDD